MSYNCSIPCPSIVKNFDACPSKEIDVLVIGDWYEIFLVFLSCTPYPVGFIIIISSLYYRTTRLVFISGMLVVGCLLISILKNILKEPRPNFECNHEYGNPSNHSFFYSCILLWFIMEWFVLEKKYRYNNYRVIGIFCILYPFLLYSRYHLFYHSIEQIVCGCLLGVVFSILCFLFFTKCILKNEWIANIYKKLGFKNNMSNDFIKQKKDMKNYF